MNIGIFSDTYTPQVNGIVTVLCTLKTELEKRGHQVFIFTVHHPDETPEPNVFRVKSFPFPAEPQHRIGVFTEKQLLDLVRPLKLDIIHTHTIFSLYFGSQLVSRKLGIPTIHTFHNYYPDYIHYLARPLELWFRKNLGLYLRQLLKNERCVIAPSRKIENFLKSIKFPRPVRLAPNGIDLSLFEKAVSAPAAAVLDRFGLEPEDEVIVFVGRMGAEKNLYTLLENFREIRERRPRARLLLVGDGPDREAVADKGKALGLGDALVITGYLRWPEEMKPVYARADLFISASHSEVHPITFLEALASGLPIVAAADSSIEDMVVNGENGWAVEDDRRLWEKAVEALADHAGLERMGRRSVEISRAYSASRFTESMLALYEEFKGG